MKSLKTNLYVSWEKKTKSLKLRLQNSAPTSQVLIQTRLKLLKKRLIFKETFQSLKKWNSGHKKFIINKSKTKNTKKKYKKKSKAAKLAVLNL